MAGRPAAEPVDDASEDAAGPPDCRGMSIEMPAAEVHHLADVLRAAAGDAEQIVIRLGGTPRSVGGPAGGRGDFLDTQRAAGRAFAGELAWRGDTVAAVADSWLRLDGALLAPRTDGRPRNDRHAQTPISSGPAIGAAG